MCWESWQNMKNVEHRSQWGRYAMRLLTSMVIGHPCRMDTSRAFIENVMENGEFQQLYQKTKQEEQETKNLLIQFEQDYPGVTTGGNVDGIAENLQKKSDKVSLLARLRQAQTKPAASELTRKPRKKHDLER